MNNTITDILHNAILEHVFPGCAVAVLDNDQVTTYTNGHHTYEINTPQVTPQTIYDCASLTKIVGPMSLAMMLIDEGILSLDTKVGEYLPEFVTDVYKQEVTVQHLLTYTIDFNIPGGAKSLMGDLPPIEVAKNAMQYQLKHAPGSNYMYSNITAFVLTQLIERVTNKNFYDMVAERVFTPLHMHSATFTPTAEDSARIPPTEITSDRGLVQGFVHDEFTHRTTAGHISNGAAGLFVSLHDLINFMQMAVAGGVYDGKRLFSEHTVSQWTTDQFPHLLPTYTPLGWGDLNNDLFNTYHRQMVVKGGFTGCFMAGDLTTKRALILLSNRTYPTRPTDRTGFSVVKDSLCKLIFAL